MIAVVGDIHGCGLTLRALIKRIRDARGDVPLYSVGDVVDRGVNSAEAFDALIEEGATLVPGNHDLMFLAAYRGGNPRLASAWELNGAPATRSSYERRNDATLERDLDYIAAAPLFVNHEDAFLSHAGVAARWRDELFVNGAPDFSRFEPLLRRLIDHSDGPIWNRSKLLNLGKLQIVGHTRQRDVRIDREANAAYVDTAAVGGAKLAAVIVERSEILETIAVPTRAEDLDGAF
ncbi:MAG: diadenosine tetraphosphatase [Ignavibacteriales bacterium]|nr:diadenosine tetraphosphatase [Ignavibacteriales bacterium]